MKKIVALVLMLAFTSGCSTVISKHGLQVNIANSSTGIDCDEFEGEGCEDRGQASITPESFKALLDAVLAFGMAFVPRGFSTGGSVAEHGADSHAD